MTFGNNWQKSAWKALEGQWFNDKYQLIQFKGEGGFGAVFTVNEVIADSLIRDETEIVMKVIPINADNLQQQIRELQLAVRLKHPCLINCDTVEQGTLNNRPFLGLVMELAQFSLADYVLGKPSQTLPPEEITTIIKSVATGLDYLHNQLDREQQRIVHRDLKPANVLRVKNAWKISDFGIARILEAGKTTVVSQVMGTPIYTPPEGYDGTMSPAWDLWSLGVMIIELFTGQYPFNATSPMQLMRKVLLEEPQIPDNLPSSLKEITKGCLIKEYQQRWVAEQILQAINGNSRPSYPNKAIPVSVESKILPTLSSTTKPSAVNSLDFNSSNKKKRMRTSALRPISPSNSVQSIVKNKIPKLKRHELRNKLLAVVGIFLFVGGISQIYGYFFPYKTLNGGKIVTSVDYSPDGQFLASAESGGMIKIWDAKTGREIRTIQGHSDRIETVSYSPDGQFLASAENYGMIKIWDAKTGREIRTIDNGDDVTSMDYSPDGQFLATSHDVGNVIGDGFVDKTINIWDVKTGREIGTIQSYSNDTNDDRNIVLSVDYSPDGQFLASVERSGMIKIWDTKTGQEIRTIQGHSSFNNTVSYSPDGQFLASAGGGRIRIWDTKTGQENQAFNANFDEVLSVDYSPDGRFLAIGGYGAGRGYGDSSPVRATKIWDVKTGKEIRTLRVGNSKRAVNSVSYTSDGRFLVSGSHTNDVHDKVSITIWRVGR